MDAIVEVGGWRERGRGGRERERETSFFVCRMNVTYMYPVS